MVTKCPDRLGMMHSCRTWNTSTCLSGEALLHSLSCLTVRNRLLRHPDSRKQTRNSDRACPLHVGHHQARIHRCTFALGKCIRIHSKLNAPVMGLAIEKVPPHGPAGQRKSGQGTHGTRTQYLLPSLHFASPTFAGAGAFKASAAASSSDTPTPKDALKSELISCPSISHPPLFCRGFLSYQYSMVSVPPGSHSDRPLPLFGQPMMD